MARRQRGESIPNFYMVLDKASVLSRSLAWQLGATVRRVSSTSAAEFDNIEGILVSDETAWTE